MTSWSLHQGGNITTLASLPRGSVDAIVTDPPYGLSDHKPGDVALALEVWLQGEEYLHHKAGFLGKDWDAFVPSPPLWRACYEVLRPGGYLVAFAGTRTADLMSLALRLAGFEILEGLQWVHGQGLPKSLDVSKTIAKRAGGALRAREAIVFMEARRKELGLSRGTLEKRIFGRADGNVRNWEIGVSIPVPGLWPRIRAALELEATPYDDDMERGDVITGSTSRSFCFGKKEAVERPTWTPVEEKALQWEGWGTALKPAYEPMILARRPGPEHPLRDPARVFYCPKPTPQEKSSGGRIPNEHPTVKPVDLMARLCRMVTPPGGVILDPFMGSGTTGVAAYQEGLAFVGMERDQDSYETARARIEYAAGVWVEPVAVVGPSLTDLLFGD